MTRLLQPTQLAGRPTALAMPPPPPPPPPLPPPPPPPPPPLAGTLGCPTGPREQLETSRQGQAEAEADEMLPMCLANDVGKNNATQRKATQRLRCRRRRRRRCRSNKIAAALGQTCFSHLQLHSLLFFYSPMQMRMQMEMEMEVEMQMQ
ncbi:hypothetical protein AWZ03_004336 [Drosophila navojoa]|uniref:Uncharacterized protein n=1 Tax=Drosophila navojoa TaxID=7232 RepID=A0A484BKD1_DRONA|nr:hypothetical protein AWZ03_004336 [Drosophila navojoa]